jgi:hypothetical protein
MDTFIPNVPAEVRGKLRLFKTKLTKDYKALERNLDSKAVTTMMTNATIKNSKIGRQRALQKAQKMLPGAKLELTTKHVTIWSLLHPREAVISNPSHPGEKQDAVTMDFLVSGEKLLEKDTLVCYRGLWDLEIPDHALARMIHRSPNIDIRKAIYEAHYWLLNAKRIVPMPGLEEVFYLPAGDGVFLGHIISAIGDDHDGVIFYFRARTWLHKDQLYDNQISLPQDDKECFGVFEMLPGPLRLIKESDDNPNEFEVLRLYKPFLFDVENTKEFD